jgi:tRNA1Val (adenine37-N6)-methyltransferase
MTVFRFKYFSIKQEKSAMKIGTDSMVLGSLIDVSNKKKVLDIGSGTGVLCLMLAQKSKELDILGIEIDKDTAIEALENCSNSIFSSQINIIHADFLSYEFNSNFDLIVSNPPFFENSYKSENITKNLARHTDTLPFEAMFLKVASILCINGEFSLVLPAKISLKIENIALKLELYLTKEVSIYGKSMNLNRKILTFSKIKKKKIESELIIRDEFNDYTEEYKTFTEHFHNRKL